MTTLALFSDIHANLPALEAVLQDMDARDDIDAVFCLGDLVGYAPWPNQVVEAIRERRIPTIAGNYDEGVGLHSDDCGCAYVTDEDKARGAESIAFTNQAISEPNRRYLRGLPRHIHLTFQAPREKDVAPLELLLVHGSPRRINEYLFEDRPDRTFHRRMGDAGADVMAFGHTHKPYHKALAYENEDGQERLRHAINIGSVGKPKDGDPRACYVLLHLDPEQQARSEARVHVEFIRVAYDVERAAAAIEESVLPNDFARMLREAH